MTRLNISLSFALLMILILGCAGGADLSPVAPSDVPPQLQGAAADAEPSRVLWGYWQCELDTITNEIIAIPDRTGSMHINTVGTLNTTLGMSVSINGAESNPAQGYFVLTIDLTHPFPGNSKLTGFDVRGILITTAEHEGNGFFLPGDSDAKIVNPDGYTRWWNPVEFPTPGLLGYTPGIYGKNPPPDNPLVSMINPYKQFADGLYVTYDIDFLTLILPTSENGRGVFKSGSTNSREYEIQFPLDPGPKVLFNYAVDASWAKPVGDNPNIPNDFPMDANGDEAFIFHAEITSSTLWSAGGPQAGGEVEIEIEIWDWQGWLQGYDGEIGTMNLISPYCVFQEGVLPNVDVDAVGKATLTATVTGMPSIPGAIPVWVGVNVPGSNYQQTATPAPDAPVAAFDLVEVYVAVAQCEDNLNDDCDTAEDIAAEDTKEGLLCLDVDDRDWFHFTVYHSGAAEGTIFLDNYGVGDLNLFLYKNCPPELLDYSANPGLDTELITLNALPEGEYYIQVIEADDGDTAPRPYSLETDITNVGEPCTTDDNNDHSDAWTISVVGSEDDLLCLGGDPTDWYTFDISDGATGLGTIELDNEAFANNDIAVYDDTISTPLYIGNNAGVLDEFLEVSLTSGTYYIRLDAMDDEPLGDRPYTLDVDIDVVVSDCDNMDGNNTWSDADSIEAVDEKTGTVCYPTDPDWFVFDVSSDGAQGTITLSSGELYDNDLYLYSDPAAPPIQESEQVGTMDEELIVDLEEGIYYIRAAASPDTVSVNQDYTLSTNLSGTAYGPTDIFLHVHIIRNNAGENPAATEAKVLADIAWGNQFWGTWVDGGLILDELTYIDQTSWLAATSDESEDMFAQYGSNDGAVNVFYVNEFPDMPGAAAYAWMTCQFINQDHTIGFIMMSDYADGPVLPHECFHAAGLLADLYWLDWYTCDDVTYCPTGPTDIYCDEADADYGNLMYWPVGDDINDYFISNDDLYNSTASIGSQGESVMYFNVNYPDHFYKP